jgi:hypothetical protein
LDKEGLQNRQRRTETKRFLGNRKKREYPDLMYISAFISTCEDVSLTTKIHKRKVLSTKRSRRLEGWPNTAVRLASWMRMTRPGRV